MNKPSTDVIRRVFDEDGKAFIEIGPWSDGHDCVELRTIEGKYSAEYWGHFNVTLSREMAAELGRALIAAAADTKDVGE